MGKNGLIIAAGATVLALVGYASVKLTAPAGETVAGGGSGAGLFPFLRPLGNDAGGPTDGVRPNADAAVASPEVRRLFDYYLDAEPPQAVPAIAEAVEAELARRQPASPGEVRRLLEHYIDYRREAAVIEKEAIGAGTTEAARGRLASLEQLRPRYFSAAESQALFGLEDALDRDLLARLEVTQDRSLSAEQQQRKLAALDGAMTPALRQAKLARFGVANPDLGFAPAQAAIEDAALMPESLMRQSTGEESSAPR
jgi:hypothetical protein